MQDIDPGQTINVRVVKQPTNEAARKTLVRLLEKDPDAKQEKKRLERVRQRHYNPQPRGGRLYGGHLVKQRPVKAEVGEQGTIKATVDVLRDLRSVERFIEVQPAG